MFIVAIGFIGLNANVNPLKCVSISVTFILTVFLQINAVAAKIILITHTLIMRFWYY